LLSAVAAGGLAGCLSSEREPAVLGFDGSVEVIVCGTVVGQSCESSESVNLDTTVPEQISERGGGHSGVYTKGGRLRVEGDIPGVGDSQCRQTRVILVELRERTLDVVVRNDRAQSVGGCAEDSALVRYLVRINPEDTDRIGRVAVRHYDYDGSRVLSGSVSV